MLGYSRVLVAAFAGCFALYTQAEPIHPQLSAKHVIILGGFQQKADAEFFANPDDVDEATVSLGDLGVEDTDTSIMAEYRYRLSEKWLLSIGTYQFDTTGNIKTKRSFEFDGVEFEAGASLDTPPANPRPSSLPGTCTSEESLPPPRVGSLVYRP